MVKDAKIGYIFHFFPKNYSIKKNSPKRTKYKIKEIKIDDSQADSRQYYFRKSSQESFFYSMFVKFISFLKDLLRVVAMVPIWKL